MNNSAKRKDIIQDAVIVLLCISAVFLLSKIIFSGTLKSVLSSSDGSGGTSSIAYESSSITSEPLYVLVTSENGTHYSKKYGDDKDELFERFSSTFGEAIGSAKDPERISESEWRSYLQNEGVFFDYVFPQSLGFISLALGTECSKSLSDVITSRLILSIDSGTLYLCYIDNTSGEIYRCETASSASSLILKISDCPSGEAKFAFEYGSEYDLLDPYFIFTNGNMQIVDISAAAPVVPEPDTAELLGYFGINESASTHYPESEGFDVYGEGDCSLRIDSDGRIVFNAGKNNGIAVDPSGGELTIADVLTACGDIAGSVFAYYGIDACLGVTGISDGSDPSSCTISFGQFIDGIPVCVSGTAGIASFTLSDGVIVRIDMTLRDYTVSVLDSTSPLPEKLAAAIVTESGGEPVLMYSDDGGANPAVSWILSS